MRCDGAVGDRSPAADLDEGFADLDAALAAEEPDVTTEAGTSPARKKGLFRRRS